MSTYNIRFYGELRKNPVSLVVKVPCLDQGYSIGLQIVKLPPLLLEKLNMCNIRDMGEGYCFHVLCSS